MNKIITWVTFLLLLTTNLAPALRADDSKVAEYGTPAGTIAVPDGLDRADVRHAIVEGSSVRGWLVKSQDDGKIVVTYQKSSWIAKLTLIYDRAQIDFYSDSTRNGKPKLPKSWIDNLKDDITQKLRAAKAMK